jgi:beta-lactamase superfamily II metal-dependent hydrolase
MQLTVFQSDKGDCLLLESGNGKRRMLIDGGVKRAYSQHVAGALGALRAAKKTLDVVYVSHIDSDHISGVLQLLDDEAAWRVHEHQLKNGNPTHKAPAVPRPPQVRALFHNSFHDQVGENSGPVEQMLAAVAATLSASDHPEIESLARERREIAESIPEAMKVSRRVESGQLNIPLNPQFKGRLMLIEGVGSPIALGSMRLTLIGPFAEDIDHLRRDWNAWLNTNQESVKRIRAQARLDHDNMEATAVNALFGPLATAARDLAASELALAKKLGQRTSVTVPNLASLMFLAEEGGQRILLTGDGHADDILRGLDHHSALDAKGHLHVDVLKVQHHGSEHNIHQAYCDAVTADHYVFCGNGEHENPDLDVLDLIASRRLATDKRRFKFWFNSSSTLSVKPEGRRHMKKVEARIVKLEKLAKGRLTSTFIKGSSMVVR